MNNESYLMKGNLYKITQTLCNDTTNKSHNISHVNHTIHTLDYIINELDRDGVIILDNLFDSQDINKWKQQIRKFMNEIDINNSEQVCQFNYNNNVYNIIKHNDKRFDIWNIDTIITDFTLSKYYMNNLIQNILDRLMQCKYTCKSIGILPVYQDKQNGQWHRDVIPLWENKFDKNIIGIDKFNITNPDFYYNLIIPLDDIELNNGGTEFILGSHKLSIDNIHDCSRCICTCSKNNAILFNGKILHRGTANYTNNIRDAIYIIYCADWYNEEKM